MPRWAERNLRVLLLARMAMSVGRAVAAVVTALYLAAVGFSAVRIGVLFVCVTIVSALMSSAIGLLADRVGRRPFLVAVPLLAAAAGVAYAVSRDTVVLFVAASLGSFGRGAGAGAGNVGPYQPAESALVAETVRPENRAAAFARLSFVSGLGALLGGLAAAVVRTHPGMTAPQATVAYRPAFLIAAGLAVVSGVLALWIREPAHQPSPGRRRLPRWPRRSWPALWRFWVTNSINGAGIGMFGPFVSYWFFRRYGASPATIGLLFALINVGTLLPTLAASRIARRLGTVRAIVAVRVIGGALLVPMVLAPSFWLAGALYFVRMMVQRVGLPLRQSFTQDMADPRERASVAALSNLPAQATMAGGQAAAGWLFDQVDLAAPFVLAAVFQIANAVAYWALFSRRPPRPTGPDPDDQPSDQAGDTAAGTTLRSASGLP